MIPTCEILIGDVRAKLRELKARGVTAKCIVTSPPYWALRDYGTEPQVWGGREDCAHEWGAAMLGRRRDNQHLSEARGARGGGLKHSAKNNTTPTAGQHCQHCSAWLGQLGLEPTPELFVEHIVEVFDCAWDVLADDGTLWMNFGDCYASNAGGYNANGSRGASSWHSIGEGTQKAIVKNRSRVPASGLKPKDLVGMPWRVAFALQASGWYLRQEIIWHKPNPMPESVTDRCTKAHEHLFLLTKSERYYFDAEAIKEPTTGNAHSRGDGVHKKVKMPDGWDTGAGGHGSFHRNGREKGKTRPKQNESFSAAVKDLVENRNKRSVWTIPTEPYSEAHYATFPRDLVRPCILAGSAPGDLVIDIFGGSGTVGAVALEYGRNAMLIDLNPANAGLMGGRLAEHAGQGVLAL